MTCEVCGKRRASIHYLEKINDHVTEMHLCEECAREKGGPAKPEFHIADLLAGLADIEIPVSVAHGAPAACPSCGMTYQEFRKIGRLGCGECYTTFGDNLAPLLKRIHGSLSHAGKVPAGVPGEKRRIAEEPGLTELRAELERAVEREEYEVAARLRDKIRELEKKEKRQGK